MAEEDGAEEPSDDAMQSLIGKQLRNLYDSVLVEPIPDKLVELLVKLDDVSGDPAASEAKASSSSDGESSDQQ